MNAEDFTFNDGSDTEVVEDLGTVFPWVCVSVLSNGLIVESVHCCDLSSFVISSEEGDVRWVFHLETQEQLECFHRVVTSVHKVTHEDVS